MFTLYLNHQEINFSAPIHPVSEWEKQIITFVLAWQNGQEIFEMKTSGSTGTPKIHYFTRSQLCESAKATLHFLDLNSNDNILLCLNPDFVAGKMMLVRALVGNLKIHCFLPSANPLSNLTIDEKYSLIALVPMQLDEILLSAHAQKLSNFDKIILGGAAISNTLEAKIKTLKPSIYHTFGMTETLTHFAMRKMNGENAQLDFQCLTHAKIAIDAEGKLLVRIFNTEYQTNDLIKMTSDSSFIWLGRTDFIINSGGFKVFAEHLEKQITDFFEANQFCLKVVLLGLPDELLGEKVVLVIEGESIFSDEFIFTFLRNHFHPYEVPKKIYWLIKFPLTSTQKIDRNQIKKLIA